MRGLLTFTVLWLLSKRDMYGQELAEELAKRKGSKPTPGTLYPALKTLEANGLVDVRAEGRRKVYTITEAGRTTTLGALEWFSYAYGDMIDDFRKTQTSVQ
jgi:DNA-binding PadR family transcriptional regulator